MPCLALPSEFAVVRAAPREVSVVGHGPRPRAVVVDSAPAPAPATRDAAPATPPPAPHGNHSVRVMRWGSWERCSRASRVAVLFELSGTTVQPTASCCHATPRHSPSLRLLPPTEDWGREVAVPRRRGVAAHGRRCVDSESMEIKRQKQTFASRASINDGYSPSRAPAKLEGCFQLWKV